LEDFDEQCTQCGAASPRFGPPRTHLIRRNPDNYDRLNIRVLRWPAKIFERRLRLTANIQARCGKLLLAALLLSLPGVGLAQITEYATPSPFSQPQSITAGPDGALWFMEVHAKIGRSTVSGSITEYTLPGTLPVACGTAFANAITTGPDGALWFLCAGYVARMTTAGTVTNSYVLPSLLSGANSIVTGPDGALWFTENISGKIGRITTGGSITEYTTGALGAPIGIVVGPDNALWFTAGSSIARITTAGTITNSYATPTANSSPAAIVTGPDGALWFVEENSSKVGRMTTSGSFTEYTIPTANSDPLAIVVGGDGALWFTELSTSKIGRVTTAGVFTEYGTPTGASQPFGIAAGADGNLWFTEFAASQIARATPPVTTPPTGPAPTPLPPSVTLALIGLVGLTLLELSRRRRSAA